MIVDNEANKDFMFGSLPSRAPLASAYVPMQESVEPNYPPQTAIARGTLFPGLDLPFRGMVNRPLPATPLGELMAIDFVADELSLYLDTHRNDREAFEIEMESQRSRARAATAALGDFGWEGLDLGLDKQSKTEFTGYTSQKETAKILQLLCNPA